MSDSFSKLIMEVIPPLVRLIRAEIKVAASGKITFPQYRVLANINRGLRTVSEIAEHQGVSQPAMTKTVNHLVKQGFVSKEKSSEDARQTLLSLTSSGSSMRQKIRSSAQKKIDIYFKDLSKGDKSQIISSLQILRDAIIED